MSIYTLMITTFNPSELFMWLLWLSNGLFGDILVTRIIIRLFLNVLLRVILLAALILNFCGVFINLAHAIEWTIL